MKKKLLVSLAGMTLLSLLSYVVLFSFMLKKPLTLGIWSKVYEKKKSYSELIGSRKKIVIVAGSNGIYSHRCSEIEKVVGLKCLNASTAAMSGIDFILEKSKEFVNPGDIVILPLEYDFYTLNEYEVTYASAANNYIAQYEREYLFKLGNRKILPILLSFDFKYPFSSIVEIGLDAWGVKRRFDIDEINANGDMINHTKGKGIPYKHYLSSITQVQPSEALLNEAAFASQTIIEQYIQWCHNHHVMVFGSFPTTFNDRNINPEILMKIKSLYYNKGAGFIETDSDSQYRRDCFYDTGYHLNEECQIVHSKKIADYLKQHYQAMDQPDQFVHPAMRRLDK